MERPGEKMIRIAGHEDEMQAKNRGKYGYVFNYKQSHSRYSSLCAFGKLYCGSKAPTIFSLRKKCRVFVCVYVNVLLSLY